VNREWTRDVALFALRLCGIGLALHGWPKVVALSTEGAAAGFVAGVGRLGFPAPLLFAWAAATAELAGGVLVAIGLFTRSAAALAAVTMAVAAFLRHRLAQQVLVWLGVIDVAPETVKGWGDPELAAVYCAAFVALTLMGGGRFSLDRSLRRSGSRRA
jgi:putative oxidoreductase